MKDIYEVIKEIQVSVKDLPIKLFEFENGHKTKGQVILSAADVRKEAKGIITKLNQLRQYVNKVRQEAELFYEAEKRRKESKNRETQAEIEALERQLDELRSKLV